MSGRYRWDLHPAKKEYSADAVFFPPRKLQSRDVADRQGHSSRVDDAVTSTINDKRD